MPSNAHACFVSIGDPSSYRSYSTDESADGSACTAAGIYVQPISAWPLGGTASATAGNDYASVVATTPPETEGLTPPITDAVRASAAANLTIRYAATRPIDKASHRCDVVVTSKYRFCGYIARDDSSGGATASATARVAIVSVGASSSNISACADYSAVTTQTFLEGETVAGPIQTTWLRVSAGAGDGRTTSEFGNTATATVWRTSVSVTNETCDNASDITVERVPSDTSDDVDSSAYATIVIEAPIDPSADQLKDSDGDGVPDIYDVLPLIPLGGRLDTDGDGLPNECDLVCQSTGLFADSDDDNDGVPDTLDAFPLDPGEQSDSDGDGFGDNEEAAAGTNPLDASDYPRTSGLPIWLLFEATKTSGDPNSGDDEPTDPSPPPEPM